MSETWLHPGILSTELAFSNYVFYRSDRDQCITNRVMGGGVFIAIKNTFHSHFIFQSADKFSEQIFVLLQTPKSRYLIGGVYIAPASPAETYKTLSKSLLDLREKYPDTELLLAGDFNLPTVDWRNSNFCAELYFRPDTLSSIKNCSNALSYSINYLNLYQINYNYNAYYSLLDLVFCSKNNLICKLANDELINVDDFHPPLDIMLSEETTEFLVTDTVTRDFYKANYLNCTWFLNTFDWETIFRNGDITSNVETFMQILNQCINRHIPIKQFKSSTFPQWFTAELRGLVFEKKKAHCIYKRTRLASDYERFSNLRAAVKNLTHVSFDNFCKKKRERD